MPLTSVNSIHFCSKGVSYNYRMMPKRRAYVPPFQRLKSVIVSANGATITSTRGEDYDLGGVNTGYNSFFKLQRMSFGRFAAYVDCSKDDSDRDIDDVSVASSKGASTLDNVDEWKFSMLLRNDGEQELASREWKDRRDYEQLATLAERMGLYSRQYAKVVVFSKIPLPNYRADLDDKRPQREVSMQFLMGVVVVSGETGCGKIDAARGATCSIILYSAKTDFCNVGFRKSSSRERRETGRI